MNMGLVLMVVLVIFGALSAMRVDMGPDKACEQHAWEWNTDGDAGRYVCTVCGLVATDG